MIANTKITNSPNFKAIFFNKQLIEKELGPKVAIATENASNDLRHETLDLDLFFVPNQNDTYPAMDIFVTAKGATGILTENKSENSDSIAKYIRKYTTFANEKVLTVFHNCNEELLVDTARSTIKSFLNPQRF